MRDISALLDQIRDSLNIPKMPKESEDDYLARLGFSLAGRWALASLSDSSSGEKSGTVSVHHFKKVFEDVFRLLGMTRTSCLDLEQITDFAYNQYKAGGFFYQQDKVLINPLVKEGVLNGISFIRGMRPSEDVNMSGLGPYRLTSSRHCDSFSDFWDLRLESLEPLLKYYLDRAQWEKYEGNGAEVSILDLKNSLYRFTWHREDGGEISLARSTVEPYRYFFSQSKRRDNLNYLYVSFLPDFLKTERLWMDLACGLICKYYGKVKCRLYPTGDYYLLKASEMPLPSQVCSFITTYSWPLSLLSEKESYNTLLVKKEIIDSLKQKFSNYHIYFVVQ